jgi:hypothetical protein
VYKKKSISGNGLKKKLFFLNFMRKMRNSHLKMAFRRQFSATFRQLRLKSDGHPPVFRHFPASSKLHEKNEEK